MGGERARTKMHLEEAEEEYRVWRIERPIGGREQRRLETELPTVVVEDDDDDHIAFLLYLFCFFVSRYFFLQRSGMRRRFQCQRSLGLW